MVRQHFLRHKTTNHHLFLQCKLTIEMLIVAPMKSPWNFVLLWFSCVLVARRLVRRSRFRNMIPVRAAQISFGKVLRTRLGRRSRTLTHETHDAIWLAVVRDASIQVFLGHPQAITTDLFYIVFCHCWHGSVFDGLPVEARRKRFIISVA